LDDERLLGQILTVDQLPLKVGELLAPEERELEGAFLLARVGRDTEPMQAAAISATALIDQSKGDTR
jgi:hypothetical protein